MTAQCTGLIAYLLVQRSQRKVAGLRAHEGRVVHAG